MNKLDELHRELQEVKSYQGEYLPTYGYASQKDIIQLIELDIQDEEKENKSTNDDGMDYEALCNSQGLSYKSSFIH